MKELTIISGKGGTGKTSLTASLAVLASGKAVLADCDVDAADLHLVLQPETKESGPFQSGHAAVIDEAACRGCGMCVTTCRFDAIHPVEPGVRGRPFRVDGLNCEGCGVCIQSCYFAAIAFPERTRGEWFVSETPHGPMVHARLGVGEENSGKLTTHVRRLGTDIAEKQGLELVIIDGPPGTGCPVISAITGTDAVLAVTEPTRSGMHDLKRVLGVAEHFGIPAFVVLNKNDINPEVAGEIRNCCRDLKVPVIGELRYDEDFVRAQVEGRALVEVSGGETATAVRRIWEEISARLELNGTS